MPDTRPDIDLLALAGLAKSSLKGVDAASMGGNSHADKINLRQMAGIDGNPTQARRPNLLRGIDFIEPPKSRPLGQVDMNGVELSDMPIERPIEYAQIPDSIQENVLRQLDHINDDPVDVSPVDAPKASIPTPDMDFDLFQFTMLKDMVKNLDISIDAMENAINILKEKKEMLLGLIKGKVDNGQ